MVAELMKYEKQLLNEMILSKRLKLSFWDNLSHYLIAIVTLAISCYMLFNAIKINLVKSSVNVQEPENLFRIGAIFAIISAVFAIIQYRRLKFKEVIISYTSAEFKEAVERTLDELNWVVMQNNKQYFKAIRGWDWSMSWGEAITIIKTENGLLINSICNTDTRPSIVSFGWNVKNINTFIYHLECVCADISEKNKVTQVEKEWSFKRILIRMFLYPFCLFLIWISIYLLFPGGKFLLGTITTSIAVLFLYADLSATFKKKK